ncbi:MAG: hypothetical protein SFX73_40560 [Kofleriaceae bacterium]|nr:hypothetical protein [Kofleriaceae bacterium]
MIGSRMVWLLVVLAACESGDRANTDRSSTFAQPPRERRVLEPPVGIVRPLPPYAIRADGVGPYRLGQRLSELLAQLPSGPRLALLEIPDVVHGSLIRAEDDDTILIGGEAAGTATFVSVVGPNVARTESGVHVGSTGAELEAALGASVRELDRAFDSRIMVPSGLRNARFVLDADRVVAITIVEPTPTAPATEADGACTRPAPPPEAPGSFVGTCMSPLGERVEVQVSDIVVRMGDSDKALNGKLPAPIVFAAPLRMPDGKDELAVITRADTEEKRTWALTTFRFEGTRLSRSLDAVPLYTLTPANARWIGAELRDIELYLELTSRRDSIEVGGLLTTRGEGHLKDVVVISTVPVPRKHGKSAPPEGSTPGTTEGSADQGTLHDAGVAPRGPRP